MKKLKFTWWYKFLFVLMDMTRLSNKLSIQRYVWFENKCGYKAQDGAPLVCYKCGGKEFEYGATYYEEGIGMMEYEYVCKKCKNIAGYWAYGYWQL